MSPAVAPLVAGWRLRQPWPGAVLAGPSQGGQGPATFPATLLELHVELFIGGVWLDITSDVRYRDATVIINRGRMNEGSRVQASTAELELDNRTGKYSPRNPTGPYYGLIGRNTPIRIAVRGDYRFHGEVSSWPQTWVMSHAEVWTPIEAAGILRRLGQGVKPLRSALYRAITRSDAVLYWPLEDGPNSSQAAPAIGGDPPLRVTFTSGPGEFPFGAEGPPGGGFTVDATGDGDTIMGLSGAVTSPLGATHKQFMHQSVWRADLSFTPSDSTPITLYTTDSLVWFPKITAAGNLGLRVFDLAAFAEVVTLDSGISIIDSTWHHIAFSVRQSGANLNVKLYLDGVEVEDDTLAGRTIGGFKRVTLNVGVPDSPRVGHMYLTESASTTAGALSVDPEHIDAIYGHPGETAADRMSRLCTEEGIALQIIGTAGDTAPMGAQRPEKLVDLLFEAAEADQGILFEPRDAFGFAYRTRVSLYNQPAKATLEVQGFHLTAVPLPVEDDRLIRNDVTAIRVDGSSYRHIVAEGRLSTLDPPDGVGTYDIDLRVNVEADAQLPDIAAWVAHVGTFDDVRYPDVSVGLHTLEVVADPLLPTNIPAVDIGDRFVMNNPPVWLPPDQIQQLVQGYTEELGGHLRTLVWHSTPSGPYDVAVLNDPVRGKLDTAGSELAEALTSGTTQFDVATTSGPLWTTDDAEFPFDVRCGGERMTVTDVAASAPTFNATGAAAHAVDAAVTPTMPSHLTGSLLLCLAAIRNSGTGFPDTPDGYIRLPVFDAGANVQLFARIAESASEAAPTITFSGSVAGADTSAQMCRCNGKWYDVANIISAKAACLNVSAQDIAYPGLTILEDNCIVFYIGWKQDDWTSVAVIAGATEIGEPDTTTGDDQGMVWDRVVQTTAAHIPAGAFVVTGGAAAISRGAVVALRCDAQEFTVTRSVNGVVKSHAAGADVRLWTPLVLAK